MALSTSPTPTSPPPGQGWQYVQLPPSPFTGKSGGYMWVPPNATNVSVQGNYLMPDAQGNMGLYDAQHNYLGPPDPGGHSFGSMVGGLTQAVAPVIAGAALGNAAIGGFGGAAAGAAGTGATVGAPVAAIPASAGTALAPAAAGGTAALGGTAAGVGAGTAAASTIPSWLQGAGIAAGLYETSQASQAAQTAAQQQAQAAMAAQQGINTRYQQTLGLAQPAIGAGDAATQQQMALLGLSGPQAQQAAYSQMQASPAQQWLQDRAQKNLLQNAAAIGGLGGGNVRSALVQQGIGFGQNVLENQYNRLAGLSQQGNQLVSNIGGIGQQAAGQAGNAGISAGEALASGTLGSQQAIGQGVQQLTQLAGQYYGQQPPKPQIYQQPPSVQTPQAFDPNAMQFNSPTNISLYG